MKIHSHTKKQLISLGVMALIFVITVIYSIGYFDFTFIDRPTDTDRAPSTQRQEYTSSPEETAYDDDYYGEEFGENFEDFYEDFENHEEFFGDMNEPYFPDFEQEAGY
jgi:hypothetical protein